MLIKIQKKIVLMNYFQTNNKVKLLVRSQAIRESTSPPRDPHVECSTSRISPVMVHSTTPEYPPSQQSPCCNSRISHSPNNQIDNYDNNYSEVTSTTPTATYPSAHNNKMIMQDHPIINQSEYNDQVQCCDNNLRNTAISTTIDDNNDNDDDENLSAINTFHNHNTSPINNSTSTNNNRHNNNRPQKLVEVSAITISCQNCTDHDCNNCCSNMQQERIINNNHVSGNNNFSNTLSVNNRVNKKLKRQNSSSFESTSASPCLSRGECDTQTTSVQLLVGTKLNTMLFLRTCLTSLTMKWNYT